MTKHINKYIKHLSTKDQKLILQDPDLIADILEEDLDKEEIEALLSTAKYTIEQKRKQQITMKLSVGTLKKIKIIAKQEGLPYQTLINSILHKYTNQNL